MRIFVADRAQAKDLCEFLLRAECAVDVVSDDTLDATIPRALGREQEELELDLYLRVWQATHPDAHVERLCN